MAGDPFGKPSITTCNAQRGVLMRVPQSKYIPREFKPSVRYTGTLRRTRTGFPVVETNPALLRALRPGSRPTLGCFLSFVVLGPAPCTVFYRPSLRGRAVTHFRRIHLSVLRKGPSIAS